MRWRQELTFIIRRLIHRRRAERELDDEIRVHLEMEIEQNVADGMSPEEARQVARRSFGSVALAKEDSRAMWGLRSANPIGKRIGLGDPMRNNYKYDTQIVGVAKNVVYDNIRDKAPPLIYFPSQAG